MWQAAAMSGVAVALSPAAAAAACVIVQHFIFKLHYVTRNPYSVTP